MCQNMYEFRADTGTLYPLLKMYGPLAEATLKKKTVQLSNYLNTGRNLRDRNKRDGNRHLHANVDDGTQHT